MKPKACASPNLPLTGGFRLTSHPQLAALGVETWAKKHTHKQADRRANRHGKKTRNEKNAPLDTCVVKLYTNEIGSSIFAKRIRSLGSPFLPGKMLL